MTEISIVITTLPISEYSPEEYNKSSQIPGLSEEIASKLVNEGLVACVNISGPVSSIFKWEEKLCSSKEQLLTMKVANSKLKALEARLRELHPYKVFEFVTIPIEYSNSEYLAWILKS